MAKPGQSAYEKRISGRGITRDQRVANFEKTGIIQKVRTPVISQDGIPAARNVEAPAPVTPDGIPAPRPVVDTNVRAEVIAAQQPQVVPRQDPTIATPEQPVVRFGAETNIAPQNDKEILENIAVKQYKNQNLSDDEVKFVLSQEIQAKQNPKQPSIEQFLAMTPEQQVAYQQMAGFQNAKQIADLQKAGLEGQGNILDERIARDEQALQEGRAAGEAENAGLIDEFRDLRNEEDQVAVEELNQAQGEEIQGIKSVFAGRGTSRQTATMKAIQKTSDNTKKRISEIERASGAAVSDYQVKLLDRLDQKMSKLEDRLYQTQDVKDQFELEKVQQEVDLAQTLFSQNPANPANMVAAAEKIGAIRAEKEKMAKEDQRALEDKVAKNFTYMVDNFGSQFLGNLTAEAKENYASALGIPVDTLENVGLTQEEQKMAWEQLKYEDSKQFDLQKLILGNEMDQQNLMMQFNNDLEKLGITHQFDVDLLDQKNSFEVDLAVFKESLGDSKALNGWGGLIDKLGGASGYGGVAMGGDSNALSFAQGVPHPAVNIPVSSLNVALAQAYPDGFKFKASDGPGGLGGQCAYYAEQLTKLAGKSWSIGNTIGDKKANFEKKRSQGLAFRPGEGQIQVGQTILTNESPEWGHVAVVNAITPDGKLILTESNYKGPLTVSNSRIIDPNSNKIFGVLKTEPVDKFKVPQKILAGIQTASKATGIDLGIPALLKGLAGGAEGMINGAIGAGKSEIEMANDPANIIKNDVTLNAIATGVKEVTADEMAALSRQAPQMLPLVYEAQRMAKESGKEGKDLTETQGRAYRSASIVNSENKVLADLGKKYGGDLSGLTAKATVVARGLKKDSLISDELRQVTDQDVRRLMTSEASWINAVLRQESGAAITVDEYEQMSPQYFPRPGDTPAVLADKVARRKLAEEDLMYMAGTAGAARLKTRGTDAESYVDSLFQ